MLSLRQLDSSSLSRLYHEAVTCGWTHLHTWTLYNFTPLPCRRLSKVIPSEC